MDTGRRAQRCIRRWLLADDPYAELSLCFIPMLHLPPLPECVHTLSCYGNGLVRIARPLPPQMFFFDCSSNRLTRISSAVLPKRLIRFDCSFNSLRRLPRRLPIGLRQLNCSHNDLSVLPILPPLLSFSPSDVHDEQRRDRDWVYPSRFQMSHYCVLSRLRGYWALCNWQQRWRRDVYDRIFRWHDAFRECLAEIELHPGIAGVAYQAARAHFEKNV